MDDFILNSPLEVSFHLTHGCNLRCAHCYLSAGEPSEKELTPEEMNKVLDKLIDMKIFKILLTGGEPMLRKDFFDIIKKLYHKMWMVLSTNGYFISENNAEEITKYIKEFAISIDGATAKSHDQFRGVKGSFDKAIRSINNINNIGDRNIRFVINTTLGKHNINEIDDIIDMAISLNVNAIRFSTLYPKGRALENKHLFFDNNDVKNVIARILERKKNIHNIGILFDDGLQIPLKLFSIEDHTEENDTKMRAGTCGVANSMFSIMPNGDIFPCEFFQENQEFIIGNALRDDMYKLWKESHILKNIRKGIESPDMCKSCRFEKKCVTIRCAALILTRGYWCNWHEPK